MASEGKLRAKPICIETWIAGADVTRGEVAHNNGSNQAINADADADENFGIFLEDADSGKPSRSAPSALVWPWPMTMLFRRAIGL